MTTDNPIIEKIRALLAKTTAAGATEEEAAAAAAAAERLLAKHKLDERDVNKSPIVMRKTGIRYLEPWVLSVATNAARFYGCQALMYPQVYRNAKGKTSQYNSVMMVGRESSCIVAVSMVGYLIETIVRMSRQNYRERAPQLGYQRGAGERIGHRLYDLSRRQDTQAKAEKTGMTTPDGTSIIVVERDEAEQWMAENLQTEKVKSRSSDLSGRAAAQGWADAEKINLNDQVGGAGGGVLALPS